MNDDAPLNPPSPTNAAAEVHQGNPSSGGNDGIPWPAHDSPFWNAPNEVKTEWLADRKAEQCFNQGLDRYIQQVNRGNAEAYPELLKEAIHGVAWSMLQSHPQAYKWLRDSNAETAEQVAEHYIEQAYAHIKKLVEEYQDYKPGKPLDRMIDTLGNRKKFD